MYMPRAQGSSHGSQGMKFSIPEACDKIKEEISSLQQQYHSLKMDYEKVVNEKNEMQRHNAMYYELTTGLNLEMYRQSELAKRLIAILGNVMPFLSQEHQNQVHAAIDRAKQVSASDLSNIMANSDDKFPKLPNGGFGMPNDNMDLYKMMASSGLVPPMPGLPHNTMPSPGGANPKPPIPSTNGAHHNMGAAAPTVSPANPVSSAASFLAQNPAALAQAMASFAGISGGGNMDEKQRTAAAVAMAAIAAAGGMPPSSTAAPNPPPMPAPPATNLPPFAAGMNASQQQLFASMASAASGQMDSNQIAALIAAMGGPGPVGPAPGSARPPSLSSLPEEKRRKLERPDDDLKSETDHFDDSTRTPFKATMENGDNKADISFSIGQNRSRTSTPNHLLPMGADLGPSTPGRNRKPAQASTPNSRPGSTQSPHVGGEYPPRNVSNPGCGAGSNQAHGMHDNNSRGHSPALSSSSAPSSGAFKAAMKQDITPNGSSATPPLGNKLPQNGMSNGMPGTDTGYRLNKAPYSFMVMPGPDGQLSAPTPVPLSPEMFSGPGLPRGLRINAVLYHGEVVCAVTLNPVTSGRQIFTGGRGAVKVWDASFLDDQTAANSPSSVNGAAGAGDMDHEASNGNIANNRKKDNHTLGTVYKDCLTSLDCLPKDSYIRSIKLSKDGKTLIVGGESNLLSIWDLSAQMPEHRGMLSSNATACYALTLSPDGRVCYSCTSEGQVCIWDVNNQSLIRQFQAHADGTSCVDLYEDQLWTGGLDKTVHCWDVRALGPGSDVAGNQYPVYNYTFPSQVFSLGYSGDWVAVGLEKRLIEMINPQQEARYQLSMHENCVLSLKFAHNRQWFASTGKDHFVNTWRSPFGANLCQMKENSSVLSCDISSDDRYLITGSGEMQATIYDVMY